jgi:hypothetical protein
MFCTSKKHIFFTASPLALHFKDSQKSNKRSMAITIKWKQKRKAKERPKDAQPIRTKKGRGLVPLVVGSYLTHGPSNVTNMQIVKSNNNGRSKRSITRQCNILLYSRG